MVNDAAKIKEARDTVSFADLTIEVCDRRPVPTRSVLVPLDRSPDGRSPRTVTPPHSSATEGTLEGHCGSRVAEGVSAGCREAA